MTAGRGPAEEMIQPQDVAEAALLPFRMTSKACPSEIVIRNAADAGGTQAAGRLQGAALAVLLPHRPAPNQLCWHLAECKNSLQGTQMTSVA